VEDSENVEESAQRYRNNLNSGVVVTDIDKNPHLTRLLKLDLNACGSDTIVMNATIVQEPSVSQIYCDNYQKAGEPSEQLEVRIVQKNIDNIP
jgi:hypothetical protein